METIEMNRTGGKMNSKAWRTILAAVLLSVVTASTTSAADTVERKSVPAPLTGTITEISRESITITVGSLKKATTIPANDVANVRWDQEPASLNLLRADEKAGHLQKAHDGYKNLLGSIPAGQKNLKTDVAFLAARSLAKIALVDPAKLDEAVAQLDAFRQSNESNFRYYESLEHLSRAYVAQKKVAEARTIYGLLSQAPWPDYKAGVQIAEARARLITGDVDGAQASFEAIIAAPATEPEQQRRRQEALLGKVACLQAKKQHEEAVKLLDEFILDLPVDATAAQAEAYLRQGDSLRAVGKGKAALLAYLHVDMLFAQEESLHAESLYQLAQLWPTVGHPDRAAEAVSRLQSRYPNSEWTKRLPGARRE